MLPLVPALALSILSFLSSVFIILRLIIPILPFHSLSSSSTRNTGLPRFKSLSPANKAHIWITICDLVGLAVFLWDVFVENLGGPSGSRDASDSASSARLWFALTIRQTCLFMITAATLIYVRLGKPVSFGSRQWAIWTPTLLLTVISTTLAGVLAGIGSKSLFIGIVSYTVAIAAMSTAAIAYLITTLLAIRHNLSTPSKDVKTWQHLVEEKLHREFLAAGAVEALKDGSSWITSEADSRRSSISAFSFSTAHSAGINQDTNSINGPPPESSHSGKFLLRTSNPPFVTKHSQPRNNPLQVAEDFNQSGNSQHDSSWLTEPSVSQTTMSAWSFPTTCVGVLSAPSTTMGFCTQAPYSRAGSCLVTPGFSGTRGLEVYNNRTVVSTDDAERGYGAFYRQPTESIHGCCFRTIGWLLLIWIPLGLSLPYLLVLSLRSSTTSSVAAIFLVLSVTISSPLLAFSVTFAPLLIPSGLFEESSQLPSLSGLESRHKHERSGSVTVVGGRRSEDVWIANGDAINGKGKLSRAASLLSPMPKLSVLPQNVGERSTVTPPPPVHNEFAARSTSRVLLSEDSTEVHPYGVERHGSTFPISERSSASADVKATEIYPPTSMVLTPLTSGRSSVIVSKNSRGSKLNKEPFMMSLETILDVSMNTARRSRSESSLNTSFMAGSVSEVINPPQPQPASSKSVKDLYHDSIYSNLHTRAVTGVNEIDSLSAKLLPLLVPGLKIGPDTKIRSTQRMQRQRLSSTMSFSSPELASMPPFESLRNCLPERKRHHRSGLSLIPKGNVRPLTIWKQEASQEQVCTSPDPETFTENEGSANAENDYELFEPPSTLSHMKSPMPTMEKERLPDLGHPDSVGRTVPIRVRRPSGIPKRVDNLSVATLITALETSSPASPQMTVVDAHDAEDILMCNTISQNVHALTHDLIVSTTRLPSSTYTSSSGSSEYHSNATQVNSNERRNIGSTTKKIAKWDKARTNKGLSRQYKPSFLPVPVRLSDSDVAYDSGNSFESLRSGVYSSGLGRRRKQDENSLEEAATPPKKPDRSASRRPLKSQNDPELCQTSPNLGQNNRPR